MISDTVRLVARTGRNAAGRVPVAGALFGRAPRLELDCRVVFIAARGLGAEVAQQAHARGAHVSPVSRRLVPLEQLAARLGERAAAFEADASDFDALQRAAQATVARFGGIDVVVANARRCPTLGHGPDD